MLCFLLYNRAYKDSCFIQHLDELKGFLSPYIIQYISLDFTHFSEAYSLGKAQLINYVQVRNVSNNK